MFRQPLRRASKTWPSFFFPGAVSVRPRGGREPAGVPGRGAGQRARRCHTRVNSGLTVARSLPSRRSGNIQIYCLTQQGQPHTSHHPPSRSDQTQNTPGSRDICYIYYTRFSHRARDDVLPGVVDSTQAATSLPDSIVGACSAFGPIARVEGEMCEVGPADPAVTA